MIWVYLYSFMFPGIGLPGWDISGSLCLGCKFANLPQQHRVPHLDSAWKQRSIHQYNDDTKVSLASSTNAMLPVVFLQERESCISGDLNFCLSAVWEKSGMLQPKTGSFTNKPWLVQSEALNLNDELWCSCEIKMHHLSCHRRFIKTPSVCRHLCKTHSWVQTISSKIKPVQVLFVPRWHPEYVTMHFYWSYCWKELKWLQFDSFTAVLIYPQWLCPAVSGRTVSHSAE